MNGKEKQIPGQLVMGISHWTFLWFLHSPVAFFEEFIFYRISKLFFTDLLDCLNRTIRCTVVSVTKNAVTKRKLDLMF